MTDKEKRELKDGVISIFKRFNILNHTATIGGLRDDILRYINSLQEEPKAKFKVGDKVMPKRLKPEEFGLYLNDPEKIIDIVGGYYILDHNQAYKIECQEHWELVEEPESKFVESIQEGDNIVYNEDLGCRVNLSLLDRVAKKEEPKKCMYSKDNYTDEDRKVLCDGCEEECRFNKKEDSVNNGLDLGCGVIWRDEEPVSEDLDSFATKYAQDKPYPVTVCQAVKVGANWQKQHSKCPSDCPAFKDGINVGRKEMKQQLMAMAVDVTLAIPYSNGNGGYTQLVDSREALPFGDNIKVLVIKED